jgi:hypothetical protein
MFSDRLGFLFVVGSALVLAGIALSMASRRGSITAPIRG